MKQFSDNKIKTAQKMQKIYDRFQQEADRLEAEIRRIITEDRARLDQEKLEKIRQSINSIF